MRKMKKINGFLVVRFNDRELREWEGTGLGNYGVIDAELYTGQLEIDRSVMEFDGAETLEEAVEQARGLEAELDVEEPEVTVTVIKETDEKSVEMEPIDPAALFRQEKQTIERQLKSRHYPLVNEMTAAHMLFGFRNALERLGIIDDTDEDFLVSPDTFSHKRETFEHLPEEKQSGMSRKVYALGIQLSGDCPMNDCHLYLNIFNRCRELDEQIARVDGWPRELLEMELKRKYLELEKMFMLNHAVKEYKRGRAAPASVEAPEEPEAALKMFTLEYQGKTYQQPGETAEVAKRSLCLRLGEDPDGKSSSGADAVKVLGEAVSPGE